MQPESTFRRTQTITGTLVGGADFQVVEIQNARIHGKLEGLTARQSVPPSGAGATTYTLEFIEGVVADPANAAAIVDNDRVTTTGTISSSPHATTKDADEVIDYPRVFRGLKVALSAAGAVNDTYSIALTTWGVVY
ncbi:MAG: hypothetical protein KAI25_00055 [Hyphomicrobiaceae bacterium]|nr:hypothetical protein [Hyphomicrobiaceae bacterium]